MGSRRPAIRQVVKGGLSTLGVFVVLNVLIGMAYANRTYPRTRIAGHAMGSVRHADLLGRIKAAEDIHVPLQLKFEDKTITLTLKELGIALDETAAVKSARQRSWLPVFNLIWAPQASVSYKTDNKVLSAKTAELEKIVLRPATDAKIVIQNGAFTLVPAQHGSVLDTAAVKKALLASVDKGQKQLRLPAKTLKPAVADEMLAPTAANLQAQQTLSLAYTFNSKTAKPTAAEIAAWYAEANGAYSFNDARFQAYLQAAAKVMGIRVKNLTEATVATRTALDRKQPLSLALVELPLTAKIFTYCTAVRGVDAGELAGLIPKLASVYADPRGWSGAGSMALQHVATGCQFTVWLAAADQMPAFGAICTSDWSCRSGTNVVINYDRWRHASDAWNKAGGSLDNYRTMVINHETGHWFGFGHQDCGGAGLAAPVMQQQSIDLQGCVFNQWPTGAEQARLKATLGI